MNLQENIRKVLREETNDRMVNLVRDSIDKIGLDFTLKVFGGYDVVAEYGDIITKKEKIQYIVNVCKGLGGGFSFNEIGDEPIPYNETKTEYSEIAHIGEFGVYIDVWGGYDNQNLIREDKVNYDKLNNKILDDIFRVSLDIAYHNGIKLEENYMPWVKRKVLREETEQDDTPVVVVLKSLYPNFNKEGVNIYSTKERKVNYSYSLILKYTYKDKETDEWYMTYDDDDYQILLNRELFETLDNYLSGYDWTDDLVNWFNSEFNRDAEYVTF
jgi:hypothetical protein